eukprot:5036751-Prymnesium_polylepis.1
MTAHERVNASRPSNHADGVRNVSTNQWCSTGGSSAMICCTTWQSASTRLGPGCRLNALPWLALTRPWSSGVLYASQ